MDSENRPKYVSTGSCTTCLEGDSRIIIPTKLKHLAAEILATPKQVPKQYSSRGTSTASLALHTKTEEEAALALKEEPEEEEEEEIATDNLLGRLRNGIRLIKVHARESMSQCDTEESRVDMAKRLKSAAIGMVRAEKSFLNTSSIIAGVVDEYASGFEEEDNAVDEENAEGSSDPVPSSEDEQSKMRQNETPNSNPSVNEMETPTGKGESIPAPAADSASGVTEAPAQESVIPVFWLTEANGASIRNYGRKLSKIMLNRLSNYEESLTDDILKGEKPLLALEEQIRLGSIDAENKLKRRLAYLESGGGDNEIDDGSVSTSRSYKAEFDDEEYDESVLPCLDPITKRSIFNAVRNKFCNHVFDEQSILSFMLENPGKRCPMDGCLNERPLNAGHFEEETKLSERIRRKNDKTASFS